MSHVDLKPENKLIKQQDNNFAAAFNIRVFYIFSPYFAPPGLYRYQVGSKYIGRSKLATALPACSSFPDTETAEDTPEQVIAADLAGDLAK
jgi:hypothetical protein